MVRSLAPRSQAAAKTTGGRWELAWLRHVSTTPGPLHLRSGGVLALALYICVVMASLPWPSIFTWWWCPCPGPLYLRGCGVLALALYIYVVVVLSLPWPSQGHHHVNIEGEDKDTTTT